MKNCRLFLMLSFLLFLFSFSIVSCGGCGVSFAEKTEILVEEGLDSINYTIFQQNLNEILLEREGASQEEKQNKIKLPVRVFKEIISYEKELLNQWISLPNYVEKTPSTNDSQLAICTAIDDSGPEALRSPIKIDEQESNFLLFTYSSIVIPVNVHIINNSQGYMFWDDKRTTNQRVNVRENHINYQFQLVNEVFNPYNIFFEVQNIDSVNNQYWNESGAGYYSKTALTEMLREQALEPATHMNLYIINGGPENTFLGEANFPWKHPGSYIDYVLINARTIPGIYEYDNYDYNLGKILIHEIGHYLGLWHTFHGIGNACDSDNNDGCYFGDKVSDTPAQKKCHFDRCDCKTSTCDTCPDDEGFDPVDNYMSYSPDNCKTRFTPGQINRIFGAAYFLRPVYFEYQPPEILKKYLNILFF